MKKYLIINFYFKNNTTINIFNKNKKINFAAQKFF